MKLTVQCDDGILMLRLKADIHKLLAAYERAARSDATKRSAAVAANNVSLTK